jgi:hypothetical protein
MNSYPMAASIDALVPKLSPTYIKTVPLGDGWGRPWRYAAWNNPRVPGSGGYVIVSAGKDGRFEQIDPRSYKPKTTTNFDCDIVYSNGSFVQYPEGVQTQ